MWQPTTAAPVRFATFTVSAIVSGFTHGRAPSWTTTTRVSESTSLSPFITESWRFGPPATTARTLEMPNMRTSAFVATIWSFRTTTTTWSTSAQRSNARRLQARTGFGPRFRNALSVPAPIRSLFPAATMIAVTIKSNLSLVSTMDRNHWREVYQKRRAASSVHRFRQKRRIPRARNTRSGRIAAGNGASHPRAASTMQRIERP